MENKYYAIAISAEQCFVDIRINDYPVLYKNVGDDSLNNFMFNINSCIYGSGVYEFEIFAAPNVGKIEFDDFSKLEIKLLEYSLPKTDKVDELVTAFENTQKVIEECDFTGEMSLSPVIRKSFNFKTDVSYTLDAWQNSVDLTKVGNIEEIIREKLRYMQYLVDRKEYVKFLDMLEERDILQCKSNYVTLSTEVKKARRDDVVCFVESGFKLHIPAECDRIMFFGKGRLACFKDENGESPVKFVNPRTDDELQLEIFFHQRESGKELSVI